jgi:hypothetical protein
MPRPYAALGAWLLPVLFLVAAAAASCHRELLPDRGGASSWRRAFACRVLGSVSNNAVLPLGAVCLAECALQPLLLDEGPAPYANYTCAASGIWIPLVECAAGIAVGDSVFYSPAEVEVSYGEAVQRAAAQTYFGNHGVLAYIMTGEENKDLSAALRLRSTNKIFWIGGFVTTDYLAYWIKDRTAFAANAFANTVIPPYTFANFTPALNLEAIADAINSDRYPIYLDATSGLW